MDLAPDSRERRVTHRGDDGAERTPNAKQAEIQEATKENKDKKSCKRELWAGGKARGETTKKLGKRKKKSQSKQEEKGKPTTLKEAEPGTRSRPG